MTKSPESITYTQAGVNVATGDRFVERIKPLVKKTHRPGVIGSLGGFGALFEIDRARYQNPLLVSGTDGVGTKVLLAHVLGRLDTVGIDLVAMCVNDILTLGAEPLFFLDYLAMGKLDEVRGEALVNGIADGCLQAGCALIGGETAEMPGLYSRGEFDLAGFAVGVVEKSRLIDGARIVPGDVLIGLPSSGLHSNGFSLARRVLLGTGETPDAAGLKRLASPWHLEHSTTLGEELLTPTRIYVKTIHALLGKMTLKGLAHVTGGGLPGNVPRVIPENCKAEIDPKAWRVPPIFERIAEEGCVPKPDLYETFNMGIGYVIILAPEDEQRCHEILKDMGEKAYTIGHVTRRRESDPDCVFTA